MRLHRLAVQAFGPFAQRVEVDFDALGEAGIFLVHGATGSGKTSLLDAVCFALFARLPGDRPGGTALRSHHPEAAALPQVCLELTLAGRRLRITRSPDHHRPKKRGTGVTTVRSCVLLEEHTEGQWRCLSTRADEAGDLLAPLLGMRLDQFAKVVLLPQGEFAAFLRATAEDRRAVLERLFDVSSFTGIEEWFKAARRDLDAALAGAESRLRAHLVRLEDVLARVSVPDGEPLPPAWSDVALTELVAAVGQTTGRLHQWAAAALADRDRAAAAAETAEAAWQQAKDCHASRDRGLRAQAELARLAATSAERVAAAARVEHAERAGRLAGDLRALDQAHDRERAAYRDHEQSARRVLELGLAQALGLPADDLLAPRSPADGPADPAITDPADVLAAAMARLRAHDTPLAALVPLGRRGADLRRRVAAATTDAQHARAAVAVALQRHATAAAEAGLARQRHTETAQLAADAEAAQQQEARWGDLVRLHAQLEQADADRLRLREQAVTADEQALAARAEVLRLRAQRLDGMAAELAAGLRDGDPCPVCGSGEHPHRATAAATVSAADVTAAELRSAPLAARAEQVRAELAAVEAVITARRGDLGPEHQTPSQVRAAFEQAHRRAQVAAEAAAAVAALVAAARDAEATAESSRATLEAARAAQADAEGRLAELTASLAAGEVEIGAIVAGHAQSCPCAAIGPRDADPARVAESHRLAVAAVGDLEASRTRLESARRQLSAAQKATDELCAAEGFDDILAARAAALAPAQVAAIRAELTQADRDAAIAGAVLDEPAVRQALAADPPDLATTQEQARVARAARSQADRAHGLAESAARDFAQLAAEVADLVTVLTEATERATVVARLADTLGGLGSDNTMRMRLSAFVLAARLERVAALANERLARMGDGRYRLEHDDSPAPGGRRSGLGLRVRDLWTGQPRDTATLSGGESFMASLALALGLADAVREESGAAALETLFVDEGFGSLDEESLEQVMSVLDELREGGRCVGVVSHVAEMRTRIPAQVHVLKANDGSTLRQVTGAA